MSFTRLGGTKCARGRRAAELGVVLRIKGDQTLAQQSIASRVHSREETSQMRIIILFINYKLVVLSHFKNCIDAIIIINDSTPCISSWLRQMNSEVARH